MKVLVLGGTVFLSRALAVHARERGHDVTCAARGVSGEPPGGVRFVRIDRALPDGLAPLAGLHFDAVVDVARQSVTQVRAAVGALARGASHWTYVSSRSVYAEKATPGQTATATLVAGDDTDEDDPANYGQLKVAAERCVLDAVGEKAFIPRPGLIVGEGDVSDRYGYWPARMSRGGEVLCPGDPSTHVQWIDVADLAAWIVHAAEQRLVGVYDATCAPAPMGELLARTAAASGSSPALTWVANQFLVDRGVNAWMGTRSLPLWLPDPQYAGYGDWDVSNSLAHGLTIRPIEDTAAAALAWERRLGLERQRTTGITPGEETSLLSEWGAAAR
ncbi:MAG TPA: NAD-dependent epimerase/dehydratase family protein [Candidatus Dormibacteraeota bacterium]|nr:NAD-dependent epimerase/dehydratase family protein [Candidatus Dormibacteraeota bacterium]